MIHQRYQSLFCLTLPLVSMLTTCSTILDNSSKISNTSTNLTSLSQFFDGSTQGLIIGGTGRAVPESPYIQDIEKIFFTPLGFHGTIRALYTPELLFPVTGANSLTLNESIQRGDEILYNTIMNLYHDGSINSEHPLALLGYSQSAIIVSQVMGMLHHSGVPSSDLRIVLIGDPVNPNGGLLPRFDISFDHTTIQAPIFGISMESPTPDNYYPTDIFTTEYGLFGDFPQYPLDFLADINAYFGVSQHVLYPKLNPDEIVNAYPLATSSSDELTHYFIIPDQGLPILELLPFIPFIGQPLYDLLEPDMRILVNLGWGSTTDGWAQTAANDFTPFQLFPDINIAQLVDALSKGAVTGIRNFWDALFDSSSHPSDIDDIGEEFNHVRDELARVGNFPIAYDSLWNSGIATAYNELIATFSADYSSLLPMIDTGVTELTDIPEIALGIFESDLGNGHFIEIIPDFTATEFGLIPLLNLLGIGMPLQEDLLGTGVNLIDIFD